MIGLPPTSDSMEPKSKSDRVVLEFDGGLVQVGRDRIDLEAILVAPLDHPLDPAADREHRPDLETGDPLQVVHLLEVLRVAHGDG